jgi:5-methyltetrahydropteroyltriglutamate--homocysteine methyltransferase
MRQAELLELRVDQVGSLLRPASLIDSFLSCAKGDIARSALDPLVERAVRDVVAKQQAIGFPVVTDGE